MRYQAAVLAPVPRARHARRHSQRQRIAVRATGIRGFNGLIAPLEYPGHVEVRRVSNRGTLCLHSGQHLPSQALNGKHVAFEEVQDGLWNIVCYTTLLGRFDEH